MQIYLYSLRLIEILHYLCRVKLGEDRLHLGNTQINLVFHSICTIFAA